MNEKIITIYKRYQDNIRKIQIYYLENNNKKANINNN